MASVEYNKMGELNESMFCELNDLWSEWLDPHYTIIYRVVGLEWRKFPRLRPVHNAQHRRVGFVWRHPTGLLHSAHLYSVQSGLAYGPTSHQHRFVPIRQTSRTSLLILTIIMFFYYLPDKREMIDGLRGIFKWRQAQNRKILSRRLYSAMKGWEFWQYERHSFLVTSVRESGERFNSMRGTLLFVAEERESRERFKSRRCTLLFCSRSKREWWEVRQ